MIQRRGLALNHSIDLITRYRIWLIVPEAVAPVESPGMKRGDFFAQAMAGAP